MGRLLTFSDWIMHSPALAVVFFVGLSWALATLHDYVYESAEASRHHVKEPPLPSGPSIHTPKAAYLSPSVHAQDKLGAQKAS